MSASAIPMPASSQYSESLSGCVRVPGDKSMSHRSLMFGALAIGETRVTGLLEGEDVMSTAQIMRQMGATIDKHGDAWVVQGRGLGLLDEPNEPLDLGNSGTSARLLAGLIGGHAVTVTMFGDASLNKRPMGRVIKPLRDMGVQFMAREDDKLPLTMRGPKDVLACDYELPVASAQVKSAVLLCGLNARGETTVIEPEPTRDHTENMLRGFGAEVRVSYGDDGKKHSTIVGQPTLHGTDVVVPADISSAAFPMVAGAIVPGSEVTLTDVGMNPLRTGIIDSLTDLGASIAVTNERVMAGEKIADLVVRWAPLTGCLIPAERASSQIDEYPVLAAAAACASGTTRMEGLAELRVKESDRLEGICHMLREAGVEHRSGPDWLEVDGVGGDATVPGGGTVQSELDHRRVMASIVLGLRCQQPLNVDDASPANTSFPVFFDLMGGLGGRINRG